MNICRFKATSSWSINPDLSIIFRYWLTIIWYKIYLKSNKMCFRITSRTTKCKRLKTKSQSTNFNKCFKNLTPLTTMKPPLIWSIFQKLRTSIWSRTTLTSSTKESPSATSTLVQFQKVNWPKRRPLRICNQLRSTTTQNISSSLNENW